MLIQIPKIPVEINRDSSFKDLRNLLGRWMSVPADNVGVMSQPCAAFLTDVHLLVAYNGDI